MEFITKYSIFENKMSDDAFLSTLIQICDFIGSMDYKYWDKIGNLLDVNIPKNIDDEFANSGLKSSKLSYNDQLILNFYTNDDVNADPDWEIVADFTIAFNISQNNGDPANDYTIEDINVYNITVKNINTEQKKNIDTKALDKNVLFRLETGIAKWVIKHNK